MSKDDAPSGSTSPVIDFPSRPLSPDPDAMLSLGALQTDEQRKFLDMVVQIRKCGLEGTLSLPQIVVCGDQSSGKSSVLEALTRVPFPRNEGLCTRYATEISLRRSSTTSITIKVIPDKHRPADEQVQIKEFTQTITKFDELPKIMDLAMTVLGISKKDEIDLSTRTFARDVLSIEITGPSQPQLTLVDIPGLIQTSSSGITKADVDMVTEITDYYIEQPRTICLAVVQATNDYSNQKILEKVRDVDRNGDRTLGVITKPDYPSEGGPAQKSFLDLANNKDIFFKLGWHVLKNRTYEERDSSSDQRDLAEQDFFRRTGWGKALSPKCLGIDHLRERLCNLLFEHIKRELPALRNELDLRLVDNRTELEKLGTKRSTPVDCRSYLSKTSLDYYNICKAAVNGHYEGDYFLKDVDDSFDLDSPSTLARTRAVIQSLNSEFEADLRTKGGKFQFMGVITSSNASSSSADEDDSENEDGTGEDEGGEEVSNSSSSTSDKPVKLTESASIDWVKAVIERNRGRELAGNYNPLLIGALFWEQSSKWKDFAIAHVEKLSSICRRFLHQLLQDTCSKDVESKIWTNKIEPELKQRRQAALKELELLVSELKEYPINYNHYYTDNISKRRQARQKAALQKVFDDLDTVQTGGYDPSTGAWQGCKTTVSGAVLADVITRFTVATKPDMNDFSCMEALDCLHAIYKVIQKTFVANVTTQVIERHIVRGLENIFSPVVINSLTDTQAEALALEPDATRRHRDYLEEQNKKLEEGQDIFRSLM